MASVLNILTTFLVLVIVCVIQGQGFRFYGDDDRFDDLYDDDIFDDLYDDLYDDVYDDLDDFYEFDDDNFFGRGPFGRGPFGFNPRFGLGYNNFGFVGRNYGFGK